MALLRSFILLLSLAVLVPVAAFAQTQPTPTVNMPEKCGVVGRDIKAFDSSVCQDDIAFGLLYEIYPSIFDVLEGVIRLEHFSFEHPNAKLSRQLGEFNGNAVFFVFFGLFIKLVIALMLAYGAALLLSVLFKKVQGEDVSEDSGEHKDNWKSWSGGAFVGASFLIPVQKNLFIGTSLVFVLSVISLSIANFTASIFLSTQQSLFTAMKPLEFAAASGSSNRVFERHDFLADSYYRYLVRMQMCRAESGSFAMTKLVSELDTAQDAQQAMHCLQGNESVLNSSGSAEPSFVTAEFTDRGTETGEREYRDWSRVVFGSTFRQSPACELVSKNVADSECGSIQIHNPDWSSNPMLELIDDPGYIENEVNKLASSLTPQASAGEIERIVNEGWSTIYSRIVQELMKSFVASDADGSGRSAAQQEQERAVFQAALTDANADGIRQLARFYHQSAYNILMFGRVTESRDSSGWFTEGSFQKQYDKPAALFYHLSKSKPLAEVLLKIQCLTAVQNLANAQKMELFLSGSIATLPADAHAKCINVDSGELREFKAFSQVSASQLDAYLVQRNATLRTQFFKEWEATISQFAEKRRAIERSFYNAMQDQDSLDWWGAMRQQGYLAIAEYARNVNAYVTGYKRDLRLMINSYTLGPPVYDSRYVAQGLDGVSSSSPAIFSESISADQVLNATQRQGKPIDPLVERYHWLSGQEQLSRQPKLQEGEPLDLTQVLFAIETPMTHLNRLGIDIHGGKSMEECPKDASKCPFPLTDPLIEMSLMGHDMIDTGIAFYSIAIGMKTGVYLLRKIGNNAGAGEIKPRSRVDGAVKTVAGARKLGVQAMSAVPGIFDVVFQILGVLMAMYIAIGAVLAYVLPQLPFLYLYFNFIAWVMVLTMSGFSVLLWSFFWLRFREKRQIIKQAGIQYGLELLLKPTLSLISVLFSMNFFYASTFLVGVSAGWLMEMPLSGEGGAGLRAFVDPLMIILIISAVYFAILKHAYNLMDEFVSIVLSKLGVRHGRQQDGMSDTMKAILYDMVQSKVSRMHDKLSSDKDLQALNQRKQRAGKTIQAMQEAKESQE